MEILGNGPVLTFDAGNPFIECGAVAHESGVIVQVGESDGLRQKYPEATFRDLKGRVLMPGTINCHTHLYGSLSRGMALKDPPPTNFVEILERLWWRLDRTLDEEAIKASAWVGLADALLSGCTTLFDHHASPAAVPGSLDILEDCFRQVGMRGCLCYEVSDRDGPQVRDQGIAENRRYATQDRGDQFRGMTGIHASFTVSDETLDAIAEAIPGTNAGVHIHVAEDAADVTLSREKFGERPLRRLESRGLLGRSSLVAHGVHLEEAEWQLLKERQSPVIHNPCSNLNNAVGALEIEKLRDAGVTVGLGTDGYTASMLDEYAVTGIVARHVAGTPGAGWMSSLDLLTQVNPEIASRFFSRPLGRLAPGHWADMAVIRYWSPTPMDATNLGGHLLFGIARAPVDSVYLAGEAVVEDGKLTRLDQQELFARARETARKVWERF